jgi:tetratricopeptide (TPR) repeat protein
MSLDNRQKQYIKKNIRRRDVSDIAREIQIDEQEVLEYLKRKWSPEKFHRFERNRNAPVQKEIGSEATFSFVGFFRENRLALLFLTVLVLLSYANSFGNGFVSDDVAGILRNPNIGNFSNTTANAMHFSLFSFFQLIAYHIGGLHPFTFRIINILIHIGCVILIFMLLDLSMKKQIAFIAAALFAVHPILTESVSWISGGLYSMYAFFFLLSFLFYLFTESNRKYLYYSVAFYVLAVFSSEKAIILFLIFVLYEFVFGDIRYNWKKIIPYFSFSFALGLLYVSKIGSRISDVTNMSYQQTSSGGFYNPLVQVPVAIGSYLKLMFWPARLSLYQTEMQFNQGQYLALLFVFLLFLGALIWSWRKNKSIFFWLAFFFITLIPVLTPFKISWIVAERYVYLGTLGIIVVAAILFDKLLDFNENGRMVGYFFLVLIVAGLAGRTIIRNRDWKSEDTLWIATAKVSPSGQQIHNNLGDVYARQGDYQKAVEEFTLATQINPNYADAYHNLANTYQQMGQIDLAIENYQKAVSINPNLWQSNQNLAAIYFEKGDYDTALDYIKKALEVNPSDQNLQQNFQTIQAKIQGN